MSVTLEVDRDGAALDEPVALDLGLGYPLWLHPLGREPGDTVPFGAVAQTSTADSTLQPGEQATFTFDGSGAAGQDELLVTRHLLAATRVGDIRRIGFASSRSSDWALGNFEIRVNGAVLHPDRAVPSVPDAAQKKLVARLAEIDRELAVLSTQYEALGDPKSADAATGQALTAKAQPLLDERDRKTPAVLVDPRSARATRTADRQRLERLTEDDGGRTVLEGRLAGDLAWYVADGFRPAWLPRGVVQTATVTLETRAHAGADTLNPAYLRAGGHKYALNAEYEPLSSAEGAQTFVLDLNAGPLSATDLQGWGLGMLGARQNLADVPDRWHAQRMLVTVDGKVVYDSEDDATDRRSLDAVRLIPPAHRDAAGAVVTNTASVRDVFLWEAGRGSGLDSSGSGAAPLPAPSDPSYPHPESGLSPGSGTAPGSWPNPSFPPYPGEMSPGYGDDSSHPGGPSPPLQGGFSWGPGGGSLWGGLGWSGQGGGWTLPWNPGGTDGASGTWGSTPGGSTGGSTTTGKPFQMKTVWISSGWKLNEPFTVEWTVSGDTSGISHFLVSLRVVRPDQSQGIFKHAAKKPVKVAVGQRSCTVSVDPKFQPKQPYYYLAPMVTAVTRTGGKTSPQSHVRIGPARAVFPAIANTKIQPLPRDFVWKGGTPKPLSVGKAGQTMKHRTVCFVAGASTPDAIQIGIAKPASHVALRPQNGDRVTVRYEIPSFKGRQQLVGHVGFMGATIAMDAAGVEMACTLVGAGKRYDYPVWKGKISTNASLTFVRELLDASDLGTAMTKAEVRVTFHAGGALDPKCVPGVYGLRLFPVKGTTSATKTVNADLAIDPTTTWLVPGDLRDGIYGGPPKQLCLAIRNNGPDPIPASMLRDVRVKWTYFVGQCGTAFSTKYGEAISGGSIRVTDLRELSSNGPWKGALPKGGVLRLVPTPPKGHARLDPDGRLRSTKTLAFDKPNAHKLFTSWADIDTSGVTGLKESNSSNQWTHKFQPLLIIGKGPLDYEVLLFEKPYYQGAREHYEYDPETQRQRLIWDLRKEPGKKDMFWKTASFMVGRKVDLATGEDHHFYTGTYNSHLLNTTSGNTSGAFKPKLHQATGSLIISPKRNEGPIGVGLICFKEYTLGVSQDDTCAMFIPLPEKRGNTTVMVPSLLPSLNDEIDDIEAWRTIANGASGPKAWVQVTLYEDGNGSGSTRTLAPPFAPYLTSDFSWRNFKRNRYKLKNWNWDGAITGGANRGIDNEVTSLKLELKGASGY